MIENRGKDGVVGPPVAIVEDVPVVVTENQEDVDPDPDQNQEKVKILIDPLKRKGRGIVDRVPPLKRYLLRKFFPLKIFSSLGSREISFYPF